MLHCNVICVALKVELKAGMITGASCAFAKGSKMQELLRIENNDRFEKNVRESELAGKAPINKIKGSPELDKAVGYTAVMTGLKSKRDTFPRADGNEISNTGVDD